LYTNIVQVRIADAIRKIKEMLIVFGALKIELMPILKSIYIYNIHKNGKTVIYEGFKNSRPVTIIQTGMGTKNAKEAAEFFKENYSKYIKNSSARPGNNVEVSMIGFCGATNRDIEVGDAIIYNSIKNIGYSDKKEFFLNGSLELKKDRSIHFLIKDDLLHVTGATVPEVITSPDAKKKLNGDFDIQAIDMESYWIGEAVQEMRLPFSCIRVVSDGAEDALPSYFESYKSAEMVLNIVLSFIRSLFSKKEFRSNINAFRNLKKANLKLAKVSVGLITGFAANTLNNTL